MPSAKRLPVGAIDLPSGVGIGLVKVPVMTPVTAVHVPEPKRMGCVLILMSGAKTNSAFRSSICFSCGEGGVGGFSQAAWAFAVRLPPVNSISDKSVRTTCFLAIDILLVQSAAFISSAAQQSD